MNSQINNSLYEVSHAHISNRINNKLIFLSGLTIFIGILTIIGVSRQANLTSSMSTLLLLVGVLLTILGGFLLFSKRRQRVYNATGSVVRKRSYFFAKEQLNEMLKLVSEENFRNAKPVSFSQDGNVRMDTMMSDDSEFAAVQISEYIPHSYQPISKVYYFIGKEAASFSNYLKQCNNKNIT